MRIVKYNLELGADRLPVLVKEESRNYTSEMPLNSPDRIVEMLNKLYALERRAEEYVYMLAMDTKCRVLGIFEISHGIIDASFCNPREILIRAMLCGAASIILVHNHPSGDCGPSSTDIETAKKINKACTLIGISLMDSIIIGEHSFFSLKINNSEIFKMA